MSEMLWNHINRRQTIRNDANEVVDKLVKTYSDGELIEFVCWFFDRLGNKYDKDVVNLAKKACSVICSTYEKLSAEEYAIVDKSFRDDVIEFIKSLPNELDPMSGMFGEDD